jgi:NAD+ kinase
MLSESLEKQLALLFRASRLKAPRATGDSAKMNTEGAMDDTSCSPAIPGIGPLADVTVCAVTETHPPPTRVALVVHPTRAVADARATVERWAEQHALELVQIPPAAGSDAVTPGDLVVALGGDGTVLAALHASAAAGAPVLGVACGSLGALTAVAVERLAASLDRVWAGDWTARMLPAVAIEIADGPDAWAVNDFVVHRRGAGQVVVELLIDDELYARVAGDGLVVASPRGSTAYSMAAGGPVLAPDSAALVCTPLAMHGGNAPPVVVPASATISLQVHPGFGGFGVEIDGHAHPAAARAYRLTLHRDKVTLVSYGEPGRWIAGLRQRQLILDSPRVLARDARGG